MSHDTGSLLLRLGPCHDREDQTALFDPWETLIAVVGGRSTHLAYLNLISLRSSRIVLQLFPVLGYVFSTINIIMNGDMWVAVIGLVLSLPSIVHIIVTLNPFLLREVIKSFEFWFLTVSNGLMIVTTSVYMAPSTATVLSILVGGIGIQTALVIDSYHFQVRRSSPLHLLVTVIALGTYCLCLTLGYMQDSRSVVFSAFGRDYQAADLAVNAAGTTTIFYLKNYWRIRQDMRSIRHSLVGATSTLTFTIKCLTLRRPLRMTLMGKKDFHLTRTNTQGDNSSLYFVSHPFLRLSFAQDIRAVTENHLVALYAVIALFLVSGNVLASLSMSPILRVKWGVGLQTGLACAGLFLNAASLFMVLIRSDASIWVKTFQSFDGLFVLAQCALCCGLLCDMLNWDYRCISVASYILLLFVVFPLDAEIAFVSNIRLKRAYALVGWSMLLLWQLRIMDILHNITATQTHISDRSFVRLDHGYREGSNSSYESAARPPGLYASAIVIYRTFSMLLLTVRTITRIAHDATQLLFVHSRFSYTLSVTRRVNFHTHLPLKKAGGPAKRWSIKTAVKPSS